MTGVQTCALPIFTNAIKNRISEIKNFVVNNPKEIVKMVFLVAVGAAVGSGIGYVTNQVKHQIFHTMQQNGFDLKGLGIDAAEDAAEIGAVSGHAGHADHSSIHHAVDQATELGAEKLAHAAGHSATAASKIDSNIFNNISQFRDKFTGNKNIFKPKFDYTSQYNSIPINFDNLSKY